MTRPLRSRSITPASSPQRNYLGGLNKLWILLSRHRPRRERGVEDFQFHPRLLAERGVWFRTGTQVKETPAIMGLRHDGACNGLPKFLVDCQLALCQVDLDLGKFRQRHHFSP